MKKILFIMNTASYSGIQLQEKFDIILTAAAFDQHIALLFIDKGIFQIKQDQKTTRKEAKNTLELFNLLEIYDVNTFYIEKESLVEQGVSTRNLSLPLVEYSRTDINDLIKQFDLVI